MKIAKILPDTSIGRKTVILAVSVNKKTNV